MDCFECWKVSFSLASLSDYAFFLYFQSCGPTREKTPWVLQVSPWVSCGLSYSWLVVLCKGWSFSDVRNRAGVELAPRLVSQTEGEGDTEYSFLGTLPKDNNQFPKALSEVQGPARPRPTQMMCSPVTCITRSLGFCKQSLQS